MSRIRQLLHVRSKEQRSDVITYGYGETPFGEAFIGFCKEKVYYLGFIGENKESVYKDFADFWGGGVRDDTAAQICLENIFIKNKTYDAVVMGTELELKVFEMLLTISKGKTLTYSDVAMGVGRPKAVRAVASTIGKNRIAYLIPCHRVIAKSGAISGYRWGIAQKKILLQRDT